MTYQGDLLASRRRGGQNREVLDLVFLVAHFRAHKFEVVYHLFSYTHRHALVLKVGVPRDNARLATVSTVWRAALWQEREIFDLLGVDFEGHPDLRRILLPEDWVGHPLRKDYVEPTEYHGISTKRESML